MTSSEDTYLEAFIESISTLPYEIRRNLDLLRVLDKSGSAITEELKNAEDAYVHRVENKVLSIPLSDKLMSQEEQSSSSTTPNNNNPNQNPKESAKTNESSTSPPIMEFIPTTEELYAYTYDPQALQQIADLRRSAKQHAQEKVDVASQTYHILNNTIGRLEHDLSQLETLLKGTGEFESLSNAGDPTSGLGRPNDLAAIQVNPNSPDWILAKIISHNTETGMYKLSDEDVESNKIFHLPETQVVVLGNVERLSKGDIIYAVYPDTTSFYQSTVVQAPRKVSGGGSFVLVNFVDDNDEHGVTHDKAVLMKHVMRPPFRIS